MKLFFQTYNIQIKIVLILNRTLKLGPKLDVIIYYYYT